MLMRYYYLTLILLLTLSLVSCRKDQKEDRKEGGRLSICFTGDVLLDRGVRKEIERYKEVKGYNASVLLFDVFPLFSRHDATVINLECPVTKRISPINKRYIFRADPEFLPALRKCRITHAAMANNHTNDQGRVGMIETYNNLLKAGITPLGFGINEKEAREPVFISKGNIRVALFNSVLVPLENWVYLPEKPGICQSSVDDLVDDIRSLKENDPDCFVITVLHWGVEFASIPTLYQRRDARRLIDAGADAIIGHHPHVIQKDTVYNGKPIFYSLGNFIFDQQYPASQKGMVASFTFYPDHKFIYTKYPINIVNCRPEDRNRRLKSLMNFSIK